MWFKKRSSAVKKYGKIPSLNMGKISCDQFPWEMYVQFTLGENGKPLFPQITGTCPES